MTPTNGISFILFIAELPINMPPKRRHRNVSESSSGAVKRIRIVAELNKTRMKNLLSCAKFVVKF